MVVLEGASLAHVQFSEFVGLWALLGVVAAARGFRFIRQFLGRGS